MGVIRLDKCKLLNDKEKSEIEAKKEHLIEYGKMCVIWSEANS